MNSTSFDSNRLDQIEMTELEADMRARYDITVFAIFAATLVSSEREDIIQIGG